MQAHARAGEGTAGRCPLVAAPSRCADTPLLPGADQVAYVDIDDAIRRTNGYAKQGAGYGYSKTKGPRRTARDISAGKPGNRRAICGRAFRKHPDTATIATPSGNADPVSCDEYPFAATYESSGCPTANGGLNAAQNIDYAGLEYVRTVVAQGDGTREHLCNDTTYDDSK